MELGEVPRALVLAERGPDGGASGRDDGGIPRVEFDGLQRIGFAGMRNLDAAADIRPSPGDRAPQLPPAQGDRARVRRARVDDDIFLARHAGARGAVVLDEHLAARGARREMRERGYRGDAAEVAALVLRRRLPRRLRRRFGVPERKPVRFYRGCFGRRAQRCRKRRLHEEASEGVGIGSAAREPEQDEDKERDAQDDKLAERASSSSVMLIRHTSRIPLLSSSG